MTRVAACGERLAAAVDFLGLEPVARDPELVLVDLDDAPALTIAAAIPPGVPRVAVGRPEHEVLLRAAGCGVAVCASADPAALGPHVVAALPRRVGRATRLIVVTGTRGGTGRTLLVTGLAERLARRLSVLVVDATGSGDAGRCLGLEPGPWSDLEGLVGELTTEHLGVVAAQCDALRAIGGPSTVPSPELLAAVAREAIGLADAVIVDAPSVYDERTASLRSQADRILLVVPDRPDDRVDAWIDERTWPIVSRSRADRVGGHAVMRSLPEDRTVARGGRPAGALARAYDEIAELLVIDAT